MLRQSFIIIQLLLALSFSVAHCEPQGQYPPRQEQGEKAQTNKTNAESGQRQNKPAIATEIECDPACSAKETKNHAEENRFVRLVRKTIDDPLAILTGLLAIATFWLVLVVLCQLRDARETAKRQLRAYLGVEKLAFECPGIRDKNYSPSNHTTVGLIHKDFLVVRVRNFGETPARNVTVFAYFASTDYPQRLPDNFFLENDTDYISMAEIRSTLARFTLNKDQTDPSKSVLTDISPLKLAASKKKLIYVYGRIYYRDIYDRPWRTKFCYSWEPWHPGGERFVPYEEYNDEDQKELDEWRT